MIKTPKQIISSKFQLLALNKSEQEDIISAMNEYASCILNELKEGYSQQSGIDTVVTVYWINDVLAMINSTNPK